VRFDLLASCNGGDCPSIYGDADSSEVVVQGYPVEGIDTGIAVPAGEFLVRIPRWVLLQAAARLSHTM
jgi:hypothetical protein